MNFDFEIPEINIDLDLGINSLNNRYQKTKDVAGHPDVMIKYANARN